jgi:hypothetical protein
LLIAAVTVVVVAIVVAAGIAIAVDRAANTIEKTGNLGGPPPAANYVLGETGRSGGFGFTVLGIQDPFRTPDRVATPTSGRRYVAIDVRVTNLSESTQESFSSPDGFHLLDAHDRQIDETIVPGVEPGAPDGKFAPGQAMRGLVIFEIPYGTSGLKLRCQGNITSAGAVFRLP